jgi:hypothetical protein
LVERAERVGLERPPARCASPGSFRRSERPTPTELWRPAPSAVVPSSSSTRIAHIAQQSTLRIPCSSGRRFGDALQNVPVFDDLAVIIETENILPAQSLSPGHY